VKSSGWSIRRKLWIWALLASAVALGLACGVPAWENRRLEQRVAQAIASLGRRDAPPIDPALARILEGKPKYVSEHRLFRGIEFLRNGDPDAALRTFAGIRPEGRVRIPLMTSVGNALYKTGRLADAERVFRQVEFEDPDVVSAHRWLVTIYHDLGAMQSVLAQLEKVVALEPEDCNAYRLMGLVYLEDFLRPRDAIESYRKALALNPPGDQAQAIRTELARALLQINDFSGALQVLDAAEQTALVVGLKADCQWNMAEMDEAIRLLEHARSLDPDERVVLYLTGRLALEEGRAAEAIEPFRLLLERDPHDVQTRYQLAQAYRKLGDSTAAAAELERMNESKALTEKLGPMFEQAILRPNDAEIRDELAVLCQKLGKRELARVWQRAAAQLRTGGGTLGPIR
jgi:tetratricopeptide (TPR) repeat protein